MSPNNLFNPTNSSNSISLKRTLIASALMILTSLSLSYLSHGEDIQPNKPLSRFPRHIGKWFGKEEHFDQGVYDLLGADDSFLCNYTTSDGQKVQLYIGFYQSQREGDFFHSPKYCMPAAGWHIVRTSLEELLIPGTNFGKIKVTKLVLEKGIKRQVMLYWFQSRGRFIASKYMQRIYLVIDSLTRLRTDGSFVRLISPVIDGNEERAEREMRDFAERVIPILGEHIPS